MLAAACCLLAGAETVSREPDRAMPNTMSPPWGSVTLVVLPHRNQGSNDAVTGTTTKASDVAARKFSFQVRTLALPPSSTGCPSDELYFLRSIPYHQKPPFVTVTRMPPTSRTGARRRPMATHAPATTQSQPSLQTLFTHFPFDPAWSRRLFISLLCSRYIVPWKVGWALLAHEVG